MSFEELKTAIKVHGWEAVANDFGETVLARSSSVVRFAYSPTDAIIFVLADGQEIVFEGVGSVLFGTPGTSDGIALLLQSR